MIKSRKKRVQEEPFEAWFDLAMAYEYGPDDKPINARKAISIYRKLARAGHPYSQYWLSLHYGLGKYTCESKILERYWLMKAAKNGLADAQFGLVRNFLIDDKEHDEKIIFEWAEKAAMQGHVEALSYLAFLYQMGSGVEKNDEKAVVIYRSLADSDNLDGLYHLGLCYQYGDGVEKDSEEAERLYRKAIELGDARAEFQLDHMLHPEEDIHEEDEENFDFNEYIDRKHPIGKRLAMSLLGTALLAIVFVVLSVVFFDYNELYIQVYAGYNTPVYYGLNYKWPVVFVMMAWVSIFAMLVAGSMAICKHRHGKNHLIMQRRMFKTMCPAIFAIMLYLAPMISRYCIGISEYHLETGCIRGMADFYYKMYFCFECGLGYIPTLLLIPTQLKWIYTLGRFKTIRRNILLCLSVVSSIAMLCLNLRIQPWLVIPYLFMLVFLPLASMFILRRVRQMTRIYYDAGTK